MMKLRPHLTLAVSFLSFLGAANAGAQRNPGPPTGTVAQPSQIGSPASAAFASIIVTVLDENGVFLNQQALVKVSSDISPASTWGTTEKRSEVEFDGLAPGDYVIEVSAAGYRAERKDLWLYSTVCG
jgi:hypothetical protein